MKFNFLKKEFGINKTVLINSISTIILQGIAFITIPIFTRILGSDQYGAYAVFNSWVSIFSIVISLSIGNCVGSGKYYFKDEYYDLRNNIIIFNTLICICISIIMILLYRQINFILSYNFIIYIMLLLTAFSSNTINLITGILIYEKKVLINFFISSFLSISNVLLSLFLIFNMDLENIYEGRVYGHLIPYLIISLIYIIYIVFTKSFKINFKYLKYGLEIGAPIVFHQLAHYILGQSDRVMMQKMGVLSSNIGIYSLFYSFCGVLTSIFGALNISFTPFYYEYIDSNDKVKIISKSKNLIELFTILCIGFLLLSREVSYIMADSEYYSGINLIPIIVGSIYFNFLYLFPVNYEFFYRKTKIVAFGTVCAALLNIILNFYFINNFDMYGAAYATIFSYFALLLFHYIIASTMKEKRFYVSENYCMFGIIIMIIFSYLFYALSSYIYIRWFLGIFIGVMELGRIIKRKAIF